MRVMSYVCNSGGALTALAWLTDVVGVTIWRFNKMVDPITGLSNGKTQIMFYVIDEEHETMIKLKYPMGTFEVHST